MDQNIARLFHESYPVIRAKCARVLGNGQDADDVAQETFLRLCTTELANQEPVARLAWIYRTSTRLVIDLWRRRRTGIEVPTLESLEARSPGALPDEIAIARTALRRIAADVPVDELEVAVLSRVDGMTQVEIAAATARSERTVRRLLGRFEERIERMTRKHRS